MDQVHEELKRPVRCPTSDVTEGNFTNEKPQETPEPSTPEGQPLVERHPQSDTEYETCDSGMSSERSSMEHVPGIETAEDNVETKADEGDKNSLKESESITSDLAPSIRSSITDSKSSAEDLAGTMEQEATEYMDNMSMNDVEVDEGQQVKQRSRGISEGERSTVRGHVQAANTGNLSGII